MYHYPLKDSFVICRKAKFNDWERFYRYGYYDMHQVIASALEKVKTLA
jgi:UDP-galactopyranose mutase